MRICFSRYVASACLAALLLLAAASPTLAEDDATSQLPSDGQTIAQAINALRAQNGLAPLTVDSLLNQAAQNHVDDLIANGMYGHYGSDGSNVRSRVLRTGYPSGLVSENWVTSGTPEAAMEWWMNDWIHRVNILDASWDEMGVGAAQVGNGYWIYVTDFANLDGQDQPALLAAPAGEATSEEAAALVVPPGGMDYTVRAGDTLLGIGLRYGIEWQDIAVANSLAEEDVLQIDQVLRLPGIAGASDDTVPEGGLLYTVTSGDTLSDIAERYAIDWHDVAAANRLGEYTVLQIGMQLRLPGVEEESAQGETSNPDSELDGDAEATAGDSTANAAQPARPETIVITTKLLNQVPARAPAAAPATLPVAAGATYIVKPGDTLFTIAARNGVTWQELARLNDLGDGSLLQIGQEVLLPASNASASTATQALALSTARGDGAAAESVEVLPGDTVIRIAVRHGVDWKQLLAVNGLNDSSLLQPGQRLSLP